MSNPGECSRDQRERGKEFALPGEQVGPRPTDAGQKRSGGQASVPPEPVRAPETALILCRRPCLVDPIVQDGPARRGLVRGQGGGKVDHVAEQKAPHPTGKRRT